MPIPSSVASRPVTSENGSPAARSRAAWIACVRGSTCETSCIQVGSSEIGTFAPVKMSKNPKMTFESTAFSRTRSETAALVSPSPVQENAATRITTARPGIDPAGRLTPRITQPAAKEKADTNAALPITGRARPTKSGNRLAGLTRIACSVFW